MPAEFVNPASIHQPFGYTHVVTVTAEKLVYISGQVAMDQNGNLVGKGDLRAQAEQVYKNLKLALEAAGTDFSRVVKLNTYVVDISQIAMLREVRDQYVNTAQPPASTAVQVTALFQPDYLIEIEAVAIIP